jgi:hypothetical protein
VISLRGMLPPGHPTRRWEANETLREGPSPLQVWSFTSPELRQFRQEWEPGW